LGILASFFVAEEWSDRRPEPILVIKDRIPTVRPKHSLAVLEQKFAEYIPVRTSRLTCKHRRDRSQTNRKPDTHPYDWTPTNTGWLPWPPEYVVLRSVHRDSPIVDRVGLVSGNAVYRPLSEKMTTDWVQPRLRSLYGSQVGGRINRDGHSPPEYGITCATMMLLLSRSGPQQQL